MTKEGALLGKRFRLLALAGKGGMGEVHRARDEVTGLTVAVKVFAERDPETTGRFSREADALARLRHPAIVEHVAHGFAEDGTPYLAMEWLEGEDLSVRLARAPLSIEEVVRVGTEVAGALAAAHAIGVVHRDIKPSNVFLCGRDLASVKLLDFGLARTQGGATFTRAGEALGTPAYMAPEQAKGVEVDARADVFSLGCVLFECLAGKPPFWADHPLAVMAKILLDETPKLGTLRPDVPPGLALLVEQMLHKDPLARPAGGEGVLAALGDLATTARSASAPESAVPVSVSLGARERQLLSVVFVGRVADTLAAVSETELPTLHAEVSSGEIDSVYAAVLRHGGWAERLVEGTIVITLPGRGTALDQAAAAAKCALTVRRSMPTHPMVLVTGRTAGKGGFPVGQVIDRGVRLLSLEVGRARGPDEEGGRGIALDDVTAGLLDRRFVVAGGAGGLSLYGERPAHGAPPTLVGRPSLFVGREREVENILALFEGCAADERAAAVLVTAPAGVGKSRLRQEVQRRLEERGAAPTVLLGAGDPTTSSTALDPVASALRYHLGIREGEGGDVSRHRVRARVGRHVPRGDRERVTAFLGELVGVPFPDETHELLPVIRADPARTGDQIRAAWEDFLGAELSAGPVVLMLEDLHASDASSVAVVDASLRTFVDRPLFVIGFARPEIDDAFPRMWAERSLVRINLRPLGPEAARRLIKHALGEETAAPLVDRIIALAQGNALFLEELVRGVAAGRGDRLPDTVVAMVESNIDALTPEARRVLRAASVFGMQFPFAGLCAVLGAGRPDDVRPVLADLVEREICVADSRVDVSVRSLTFSFASEIVRAAAYEKLTEEDRVLGHRLAAEWLEATAGPREASIVAGHFDRAGDERRAAMWYARAAEIALGQGDYREAVERGDRGAVAGASGPLLGRTRLLQAEALRHLGDNEGMLQRAREAMTLLPARTPGWWTAAADAVLAATRTGASDEIERLAAELTVPPIAPVPPVARVAVYLFHVARLEDARQLLEVVRRALAQPDESAARWGWGHRALAYEAMFHGDIAGYLAHAERAVASFQAGGDTRELAQELVGLGYARHELGLYEEAERSLLEGHKLAERLGLRHVQAAALENLGGVRLRLGRLDEAEADLSGALHLFKEQKNRRMEGHSRKQLALVHVERGEVTRGLEELMHASQLLSSFPPLVPATTAALARVLLTLGRVEDALHMARDASGLLADLPAVEEGEASIRLVLAEVLFASGDVDAARTAISSARTRLMARGAKITDEAVRATFLHAVKENARTLELASAWLEEPGSPGRGP